jgi:hypothetical protein
MTTPSSSRTPSAVRGYPSQPRPCIPAPLCSCALCPCTPAPLYPSVHVRINVPRHTAPRLHTARRRGGREHAVESQCGRCRWPHTGRPGGGQRWAAVGAILPAALRRAHRVPQATLHSLPLRPCSPWAVRGLTRVCAARRVATTAPPPCSPWRTALPTPTPPPGPPSCAQPVRWPARARSAPPCCGWRHGVRARVA